MNPPGGVLSFLKPEHDSYKGRVQRDLENRMMRMMRTRRTTFSGNKMSAGLDENLNLNLRWRLRFQAKIVRWNRCCVRREAQLLMGRRLLRRCISLRACVLMEGTFEAPTASTEGLKTSNIHNPGLHFLRKALLKLLVIYIYIYLFLGKPKPEEAVYNNQMAYTCEDPKEDIEISERSTSRGCKIGRQRVQVLWWTDQRSHRIIFGSKVCWPQTLKVLGHHQRHWQSESGPFGNWERGGIPFVRRPEQDLSVTRKTAKQCSSSWQANKHENNLFFEMVRSSNGCEAGSLAECGWTLFLNDAEVVFFPSSTWARRKYPTDGRSKGRWSIKQLLRTKEEWLLCNLWDQVGECQERAASCKGYFSSQEPQNLETMTRARMAATRSCVCYVSNEDAGKWHAIECLATMLYERVHQVTTVGDANKMARRRRGQQLHFSYCVWAFYFGWTGMSWQWIHSWIMLQDRLWGMCNLRTFHIAPHLRLKFLKEPAWWEGWCGRGHQKEDY